MKLNRCARPNALFITGVTVAICVTADWMELMVNCADNGPPNCGKRENVQVTVLVPKVLNVTVHVQAPLVVSQGVRVTDVVPEGGEPVTVKLVLVAVPAMVLPVFSVITGRMLKMLTAAEVCPAELTVAVTRPARRAVGAPNLQENDVAETGVGVQERAEVLAPAILKPPSVGEPESARPVSEISKSVIAVASTV